MKIISIIAVVALAGLALFGCEFKKNISREEIPIIKQSIGAVETAVKARDAAALDSLLADESEETVYSILGFVYADSAGNVIDSFVGFVDRQIFFRGDAARVDCSVAGPDGPAKDITMTFKKENDVWRIKRMEVRKDDPLKEEGE